MYPRTLAVALAALVAATVLGQTDPPSGGYVGTVTGSNVYVRSGPGESYPCVKLSPPATVQVVEEQFGWLKILPPAKCYSLIHKRYVRAEGEVGTVNATNVNVRAGSSLHPQRAEVVQTRLNVGDKVKILGQSGDYYMVTPPPGAYLWISAAYVKALPQATATGPTSRPVARTQPATAPTTGQGESGQVVVTTRPQAQVNKDLAAFEAAEAALTDEFKKPMKQRDLDGLLKQYQALAAAGNEALAPYVEARIKFIQGEIELASDLDDVEELLKKVRARQEELTNSGEQGTTGPKRAPVAEGLLSPSRLFPGGATGPKRYTVRDPDTRVIYAFVQCTSGAVDLRQYVGQVVGVIGSAKFDEHMKTYVIEVEQVTVVEAPAPSPPDTQPTEPEPPAPPPPDTQPTEPEPPAPPPPDTQPVEPEPPAPPPDTQPVEPEPPAPPPDTQPGGDLPKTGLPVAETRPATRPVVNHEEYE